MTMVIPEKISLGLVAERDGHHPLGRVRWSTTPTYPTRTAMAFIFRGILVLTAEDGLVFDAFPLWGCSISGVTKNDTPSDVAATADEDDDDDDDYDEDDFEDAEDEERQKQVSLLLHGVTLTLAVRTASASTDSGGALATTIDMFPVDFSVERLANVVEAATEHYRPRGGWCVPRSMMLGNEERNTFQCMLMEETMTRWPGTLRVSRDVVTFRSDSPLGKLNVTMRVGDMVDVLLSGQNVMPPTNALTIKTNTNKTETEQEREEHTFTTLSSAGLALQCIMNAIREHIQTHCTVETQKLRTKENLIYPGQKLPTRSLSSSSSSSSSSKRGGKGGRSSGSGAQQQQQETTPNGFTKIPNFYHDTLLDEEHHFGPKGRHSPVVKRILGLVVVDNLEPNGASASGGVKKFPTPPTSARGKRRRGKSPKNRSRPKVVTTPSSSSSSILSSPSTTAPPRVHWTKEIKVLSLLNFTSGSGRPFTQLVRHVPSRKIFALGVIPSQTQNMFELARQAVVALRVDHPNICRCYGTTQVGESIQFLWEHGPKTMLEHIQTDRIERGVTSPSAMRWIRELIRGLSHLHSLGIVHRNILTRNLTIMKDGSLRLNDFGLSKYLSRGRTTTICGEPTNMSPERVLGHPHGFGADWWSVGLILHELFSGISLFSLGEEENMGVYERIVGCRYFIDKLLTPSLASVVRKLVCHETHRLGLTGFDRDGSCGAEVQMYLVTREWWSGEGEEEEYKC